MRKLFAVGKLTRRTTEIVLLDEGSRKSRSSVRRLLRALVRLSRATRGPERGHTVH